MLTHERVVIGVAEVVGEIAEESIDVGVSVTDGSETDVDLRKTYELE